MKNKILSILCALSILVSMVAFGSFSASADGKADAQFSGFDKATCVLPDDMPWNSSGSGLFKTSGFGDGLVVGNQAGFGLTADLGTYSIDNYFKVDFDLWYKNKKASDGCVAGVENHIVTIGDLAITFTRCLAEKNDNSGKYLYLQSVTYKGQEAEIVGEKTFTTSNANYYEHNSDFIVKQANEEFHNFLEENMIRKSWMFNNNAWANTNLAVEVTYDSGTLTIKNTSGEAVNSVTADLTKVAGFDVTNAFHVSKVTATVEATDERGAFVSIISDFHGEYKKGPDLPAPPPPSSTETSSTVESSDATSSDVSSEEADSSTATSSEDNAPAGNTDTDTDNDGGNGSNIATIIIIVVAACAVVAGGVVAFILLRKKNTNVEEEPTEEQGE